MSPDQPTNRATGQSAQQKIKGKPAGKKSTPAVKATSNKPSLPTSTNPLPAASRAAVNAAEKQRVEVQKSIEEDRAKARKKLEGEELVRAEKKWAADDLLWFIPSADEEEVEMYTVRENYGFVKILRNRKTHEMSYYAIEPRLNKDEQKLLDFIENTLVDVLELQPSELDSIEVEDYIRKQFKEVIKDYGIKLGKGAEAKDREDRLMYYLIRDFVGEGPIDLLFHDPNIEDISCDGPHVPIFVYHRKYEALTSTIRFRDGTNLDSFVIRMAQRAGKHVSIAEPILDATMRDGSRLQATLGTEVSSFGSTFTLRKFKETPFTPIDLVRFGTMSAEMLAYLWMVIEGHMSAIYAGGTASGKTTSINALMMFIPPQNKVITIEDTRELRVPEPNWIAGITRDGFGPRDEKGRQAGEIDMFQLLKNALRQRPEFIVVGEVRGAEAFSLFQAMATGHAAYGTMHADSVSAVIHRLESEPINIPRSLLEALDVVAVQIQTRVGQKRVRRTSQITEIVGLDPNTREILTNEVFIWNPEGDRFSFSGISYALDKIGVQEGKSSEFMLDELRNRTRLIDHLVQLEVSVYEQVAEVIRSYYRDRERVVNWMKTRKPWR